MRSLITHSLALLNVKTLRLYLFSLKMISGNHFTLAYVFGKHKKLGQTEINFCLDRKITLSSRKWISVSILPSNEFQDSEIKRERERGGESKKREHKWFAQLSSGTYHRSFITAKPSSSTNTYHQSLITAQPSFDTNTHHQSLISSHPPSSQIHKHPRPTSPITLHLILIVTTQDWSHSWPTQNRSCRRRWRLISLSRSISLSLNLSIFLSLIFEFFVVVVVVWVVVFVLCGGGFCVDSGGFSVGASVWVVVDFLI